MKKKKFIKSTVLTLASVTMLSGLAPSASAASAQTQHRNTTQTVSYPSVGQLSQKEIYMFLNNGAHYNPTSSKSIHTQSWVSALAKKIAVQALRKSGTYLEKPLSKVIGKKYAKKAKSGFYKVADYIEKVQNVQEKGIAAIFIKAGLPPDVAYETAKWIVLFFGL
ncbi:hypothetical protein [Bacillus sonorensis]|uniref:hypothetical protein n=1 Tax=Bacillus sonorensis TaxID=119858 RepID=UPI000E520F85|nr:hypothetical protein [Bacillus sonorensis]RHJ06983.1 hypothetical protein DW143_18030 [Bacillus sonorensis]WPP37293.1 hypothetical protein SK061_03270 [Bacillus sonorensis]